MSAKTVGIPTEYWKWIGYEVFVPLFMPAFVFAVLAAIYIGEKAHVLTEALISIAGGGDLFVFAGLLLINVSGNLMMEKEDAHGQSLTERTLQSSTAAGGGVMFLLVYVVVRILTESNPRLSSANWKFLFSGASVVLLIVAVLWADLVVRAMHLRKIESELEAGRQSHIYNL